MEPIWIHKKNASDHHYLLNVYRHFATATAGSFAGFTNNIFNLADLAPARLTNLMQSGDLYAGTRSARLLSIHVLHDNRRWGLSRKKQSLELKHRPHRRTRYSKTRLHLFPSQRDNNNTATGNPGATSSHHSLIDTFSTQESAS